VNPLLRCGILVVARIYLHSVKIVFTAAEPVCAYGQVLVRPARIVWIDSSANHMPTSALHSDFGGFGVQRATI